MINKQTRTKTKTKQLQTYLRDARELLKISTSKKHDDLMLPEYPFDGQLLSKSSLYRSSRKLYLSQGGTFAMKVCSVARSLSAQDIFANHIEYSPILSEISWFQQKGFQEVADPMAAMLSLADSNGVSIYHEQNHRIVWSSLPAAPMEKLELGRYLNFAESIVVALDLALADQLGIKLSSSLERMKSIYRTAGLDSWAGKSKKEYRKYLHGVVTATYFLLELYNPKDIQKGLSVIFPNQKVLVKDVVRRSLDLSDLFILNTNQIWQERYWQFARDRLSELHSGDPDGAFYLPEDPLEFGINEFALVDQIFTKFGL